MKKKKTKQYVNIIILISFFTLISCSTYDKSDKRERPTEIGKQVIKNIQEKNKEDLKNILSERILNTSNLDGKLDQLYSYIPKILSYEKFSGAESQRKYDGKNLIEARSDMETVLTSIDGDEYRIIITYYTVNIKNPNHIGVDAITIFKLVDGSRSKKDESIESVELN